MKANKSYNGHKNYNHWNVSLWINNDEGLYNDVRCFIDHYGNKDEAAKSWVKTMQDCGMPTTPDGVAYSVSSVRAAMVGM